MILKKWLIKENNREEVKRLEDSANSYLLALLMYERGIRNKDQLKMYVDNDSFQPEDPLLLKDMEAAVNRIQKALDQYEMIAVFGDYDADGITATALLYSYLESAGGNVIYYIPNRDEGYGLNCEAIRGLSELGVQLIITVDNGITAVKEVEFANSLAVDVVITDHHKQGEIIPEACAVVDPHRLDCPSSFKDYAGVGVAFLLVCAMEGRDSYDSLLENYADLVAIGTIGDSVSITEENRFLVKHGLFYLNNTDRVGLNLMLESVLPSNFCNERQITSTDIAFTIVPRINAAGRVGNPSEAVELLLSDDPEQAEQIVQRINANNSERKEIENRIMVSAQELIHNQPGRLKEKILVVEGENWNAGVIGIVASRLAERYGRPSVVISMENGVAKGSARGFGNYSIYDALAKTEQYLEKFGGHAMAAGFTLNADNIDQFKEKLVMATSITSEPCFQTVELDCKLLPEKLSLSIPRALSVLEPYGTDNPQPLFGLFGVNIIDIRKLGNGNHIKLTVRYNTTILDCVCFGMALSEFSYDIGDSVDLAVQLQENIFKGRARLEIIVREIKMSGIDINRVTEEYARYRQAVDNINKTGLLLQQLGISIPDREDFAGIYRYLSKNVKWDGNILKLYNVFSDNISFDCFMIAMTAFHQSGLITMKLNGNRVYLEMKEIQGKVDLLQTPIMNNLHTKIRKGDD